MSEEIQMLFCPTAIPFEKMLSLSEICRNQEQWNFSVVNFIEEVKPKFIFHKNNNARLNDVEKFFCIGNGVGR